MSMKEIAEWALNVAEMRGAGYADVRIVDERNRALSTKNGKIGYAAVSESLGAGIRVLADHSWGFAATEDLSRKAIEEFVKANHAQLWIQHDAQAGKTRKIAPQYYD